jgi:beta-N-acetylhexosaminidase
MGFEGVIISDQISMGALTNNFSIREIIKNCLLAGVDLILCENSYDTIELIEIAEDLYERGEITEEGIDQGVRRIVKLKIKYGLIN